MANDGTNFQDKSHFKDRSHLLVRALFYSGLFLVSWIGFVLDGNFINWSYLSGLYVAGAIGVGFGLVSLAVHLPKTVWIFLDLLVLGLMMKLSYGPTVFFVILFSFYVASAGLSHGGREGVLAALMGIVVFNLVSVLVTDTSGLLYWNAAALLGLSGLGGYFSDQIQVAKSQTEKVDLSFRALEELNRVVMGHLPVGVVSLASSGAILNTNEFAKGFFEDSKGYVNFWERLGLETDFQGSSTQGGRIEKRVERIGTKELRLLGISISSYEDPKLGEPIHIAVLEDLTDQRRLEETSRQNEKLAAIGGLAAGIAHEIRNPLASISGSVEMLSQTIHSEDDRKLMKIILREIHRLNHLITEFLDYARADRPMTDSVSLSFVLNEVVESVKADPKFPTGVLEVVEIEKNVQITGNADKLRQVFWNLLTNALQALKENEAGRIQVSLTKQQNFARIRIQDNGRGMSLETKRRLFEPFYTTKSKGTGLGLAITHKIIQSHKGEILVESEEGIGSVFTLTFPCVSQ